jgi:hypothetical protein
MIYIYYLKVSVSLGTGHRFSRSPIQGCKAAIKVFTRPSHLKALPEKDLIPRIRLAIFHSLQMLLASSKLAMETVLDLWKDWKDRKPLCTHC